MLKPHENEIKLAVVEDVVIVLRMMTLFLLLFLSSFFFCFLGGVLIFVGGICLVWFGIL